MGFTQFKPITATFPPYRTLAMDGGGIHGLFTSIMLRKLCEKDDKFLKNDQVTLFAGTSAGALISLVLARAENPRDAVLSRELELLFSDGRLYNNRLDPLNSLLSYTFIPAWTGRRTSMSLLEKHFGDLKMGELKHRVLITTFNMKPGKTGHYRKWKPKMFYNFPDDEPDRKLLVRDVAYGATSALSWRPVVNGITDGGIFADNPCMQAIAKMIQGIRVNDAKWNRFVELIGKLQEINLCQKKLMSEEPGFADFSSFLESLADELAKTEYSGGESNKYVQSLRECSIYFRDKPEDRKEIFRKILQLSNDELVFIKEIFIRFKIAPRPELQKKGTDMIEAVRKDTEALRSVIEGEEDEKLPGMLIWFSTLKELIYVDMKIPIRDELIDNLSILSLGVGTDIPYYWAKDFSLGLFSINSVPINIFTKNFWIPLVRLTLEPSVESAIYQARQLLGKNKFHRLDPEVIGFPVPPVVPSVYLSRYQLFRTFVINQIYHKIEKSKRPEVDEAIDETLEWLNLNSWV